MNSRLRRYAWPSAGTKRIHFDAFSLQTPISALTSLSVGNVERTSDELAGFQESIKFADCLPWNLISRVIVARNFELSARGTFSVETGETPKPHA